jgi:transcriptional regulator with XRE-family HTH domain
MNMHFPRIITLLRKEKRFSQKKVASDLGISQALLSHYEKGIRECGLDFLVRISTYYNVSCDYLLGKTPDKTGRVLNIEDIPDLSDISEKENVFKGSLLATLNKKLIMNSLSVIFDLLDKIKCKSLTKEISAYLTTCTYKMFRIIYSINSKNPQSFFCVQQNIHRGFSDAASAIAEARANVIVSEENLKGIEKLEPSQRLILSPDVISTEYPLFSSSLYNLIQNAEALMGVKR